MVAHDENLLEMSTQTQTHLSIDVLSKRITKQELFSLMVQKGECLVLENRYMRREKGYEMVSN